MPTLQTYTVYTSDNQVADQAERRGMRVHLINGPYEHVLREAHTVYLFGSHTPLRDQLRIRTPDRASLVLGQRVVAV